MNYNNLVIDILSILLIINFVKYTFTSFNLLSLVLKIPKARPAERDECPEYIRRLYEAPEKELAALGFEYVFSQVSDEMIIRKHEDKYYNTYYNSESRTFASLTMSPVADEMNPVTSEFFSYL